MKSFVSIFICSFMSFLLHSQTYTLDWKTNNNAVRKISIEINLNFSKKSIMVRKSFESFENSQKVEQNTLELIGDFINDGQNIILDYKKYYYYLLPFDPNIPFMKVNRYKYFKSGNMHIEINQGLNSGTRSGDVWFWSTCGLHTQDSISFGGCLSLLEDNVVRCVPSGGGCPNICIGNMVEDSESRIFPNGFQGGCILIQTEKPSFAHDFQTGAGGK